MPVSSSNRRCATGPAWPWLIGNRLTLVAELSDRRDHRARAHAERFGDAAALGVAQHVVDGDALLGDRVAQVRRHPQDGVAGDPVQDAARERGGADVRAVVDEGDVHRADLVDVAALDRVEPEHLLIAGRARLLDAVQAARIVARGLGLAGSAAHRAYEPLGHQHGHRLEAGTEVRSDGAQDDVVQILAARAHLQAAIQRDHDRPDIERRALAVRCPAMLQPHQFHDRLHVRLLVHRGHSDARRRAVEALGVLLDPEQVQVAVGSAIGLGAVEHHLPAVEYLGRRIERERLVRTDGGVVPAALRRVALREHAIGEHASEPQLRGQGLRNGIACRFDPDVHRACQR